MQQAGIASFRELSHQAGVSMWQIQQLRRGEIRQMRLDPLHKLSLALQVGLPELFSRFSGSMSFSDSPEDTIANLQRQILALQQEYAHLQQQLAQQQQTLPQELQREALQILETWMLYWPTAAHAVRSDPQFAATKLLPLLQPLEKLLAHSGGAIARPPLPLRWTTIPATMTY